MLNERKENIPPRAETPEIPFGAKLGGYEERRKKLQEERNREYNQRKSEVDFHNLMYCLCALLTVSEFASGHLDMT